MEPVPATRPSLLDPVLVAKLSTMELRARRIVEGTLAGRHRSFHQGHSQEFTGHRPYSPSDDLRYIDWKVFAKTERWVVREQQEETNLRVTILLDASRSMDFSASGRVSKLRYASFLTAALGYLLVNRRESVGLGVFDKTLRDFLAPRGGAPHLNLLLDMLDKVQPAGTTDIKKSLEAGGQNLPRRSLILVVSDFLLPPDSLISAMRMLVSRKHEVMALQVLDPMELDFPLRGEYVFEDLESGERVRTRAEDVAEEFRRRILRHQEILAHSFASLGVDHFLFRTDTALDVSLSYFLQRRLQAAPSVAGRVSFS